LRTRLAGLFLFLPLLARVQFERLVEQSGYPSSKKVPAASALLSLLVLKLVDKERRSHINDFNCDAALGLFAGLNILPKKSFATDYSYRTRRGQQVKLLEGWVSQLSPLLFPEADSFSLDFHAIPYRGDEAELENHYVPLRGKACPSVLTFFAQERNNRVLCYANANLTRDTQAGELRKFVQFWRDMTGKNPQWLYFDSKLVPYAELSWLNEQKIWFVTIRRRGAALLKRLASLPESQWRSAVIDIPKRRHQHIEYFDERVRLENYAGEASGSPWSGSRSADVIPLQPSGDQSARNGEELRAAERDGGCLGQQRRFLSPGLLVERSASERGLGHGPDRPRARMLSLVGDQAPWLRSGQTEKRVPQVRGDVRHS
jgi:hypothetical protein